MTTRISQYLGGQIAEWLRGNAMASAPASIYLALSSTTIAGTGVGITELGGTYARQPITLSAVSQSEGTGTITSNSAPLSFTGLAATVATHFAIFDAVTGGNMLFFGPIAAPISVSVGGTISFASGIVVVHYDGLSSYRLGGAVLNWLRGTAMLTPPTGLYLSHSSTPVLRNGTGTTEPTGGYTRQLITFGSPSFTTDVGTVLTNTNNAVFGPATLPWGPLTHASLMDQAGNILLTGSLAVIYSVETGNGRGVNAGSFSITVR